jgi:eukaryotic-like serine/threonine-protein kinase
MVHLKQRQLTVSTSENPVTGGEISPDARYLAYTDWKGIHLKLIATGETGSIAIPDTLSGAPVTWELGPWLPDSTRFLALAELPQEGSSLWMVSVAGGVQHKLRDEAAPWSVSPDGTQIAFAGTGEHEIWIMGTDGGHARKLEGGAENEIFRAVQWSADAERVAYIKTTCWRGNPNPKFRFEM